MANLPEQTLTTGVVRLSYAHLFKSYAHNPGQEAKYSTTVLVPKTDLATKQAIDLAIEAAKRTGAAEKFQGVIPPILAIPVHDGDGRRPSDGLPFGEECKGNWVFTASSKNPIPVVSLDRQPILNETEVYSGVYAYVSVTFFPYNSNGKKGIGCALNAVMKAKDGEPLGGGVSVDKAFANIPMQAQTPAAQTQPVYPTQSYAAQPAVAYAAQPTYAVQPAAGFSPQPTYPPAQPAAAPMQAQMQPAMQPGVQINPITGQPMPQGGVMGL